MDTVQIQTTQNIAIEFQMASIGDRILATIIDFSIFFVYFFLLALLEIYVPSMRNLGPQVACALPAMFYSVICETCFQGRSFGKMVMKIQVVKIDGGQAKFVDYLLRWVFRILDVFLLFGLVGLITFVANGKGQRVGDIAASTTLIKQKKKASLQDTILTSIKSNYIIQFPEVSRLTDQDISIIKDVLLFDKQKSNDDMVHKLFAKIQKTMGVEVRMEFRKFLETIVDDYAHFNFEK